MFDRAFVRGSKALTREILRMGDSWKGVGQKIGMQWVRCAQVCARVTILKFSPGQNSKNGKDYAKTNPRLVVKISVFGRAIAQVRKGVWPEERLQRVGLHQAHLHLQRGYLA